MNEVDPSLSKPDTKSMAPDQTQAAKRWKEGAWDAFDTAEKLFISKKYHHSLFFCHLAVEKALKAQYITDQDKLPPYTHELALIAAGIKDSFNENQLKELEELNTFNIAGRYEEEKLGDYPLTTSRPGTTLEV